MNFNISTKDGYLYRLVPFENTGLEFDILLWVVALVELLNQYFFETQARRYQIMTCDMDNPQKIFELDYKGEKIKVERHTLASTFVYRVLFADKKIPLVITRATNANAARWWTSIPEGRQQEAEEIGPLIAEYIKSIQ